MYFSFGSNETYHVTSTATEMHENANFFQILQTS